MKSTILSLGMALFVSASAATADPALTELSVAKGRDFLQTTAGTGLPADVFDATAIFRVIDATASIVFPYGATNILERDFPRTLRFYAANFAAPDGDYVVQFNASDNGVTTVKLSLSGTYPNAPEVANFEAAQAIDVRAGFKMTWRAFTNGTASDFIQLKVFGSDISTLFDSGRFGTPGALDGTATSVVIPANALPPGRSFNATLKFFKVSSTDSSTIPGAHAYAGYYALTTLTIATKPAAANAGIGFIRPVIKAAPDLAHATAAGDSMAPLLTPDGTRLAFVSAAPNLLPVPSGISSLNLYISGVNDGAIRLVSTPDGIAGGNGNSWPAQFSSDGGWLLFSSAAENLIPNDTNHATDIFLADSRSGRIQLISLALSGGSGNGASRHPVMTPDGRFAAFESLATDLVTNGLAQLAWRGWNIYLRDLQNQTTTLISQDLNGTGAGLSQNPALSADGQRVAFTSSATNIATLWTNHLPEVYLRDLSSGRTIWASRGLTNYFQITATNRFPNYAFCGAPRISADGRFLYFKASYAPVNAGQSVLFRYDVDQDRLSTVAGRLGPHESAVADYSGPEITPNGQWMAYDDSTNVYVWNADANRTIVASLNPSGLPGNGRSHSPQLSDDGRFVAFISSASDLVTNKTSGDFELYLRDLRLDQTYLISQNSAGEGAGMDDADLPSLSADGQRIAFCSIADTIASGDRNHAADVFVRDVPSGQVALISRASHPNQIQTPNGRSWLPAQPWDNAGQQFVFSTLADDLAAADWNQQPDVFVQRLVPGLPQLVTANRDGQFSVSAGVWQDPVLSGNGRRVAYVTRAGDLTSVDASAWDNIFVRDLVSGETLLATAGFDGISPANASSAQASVSEDGQYVAFLSLATNLVAAWPAVNGTNKANVFLRDLLNNKTYLISASSADPTICGNESSADPVVSPDGQWVLFHSISANLVAGTAASGYFLRDWRNQTTRFLARTSPGTIGNFSGDSRFILLPVLGNPSSLILYDIAAQTNSIISNGDSDGVLNRTGDWIAYRTPPSLSDAHDQIWLYNRTNHSTELITADPTGTQSGDDDSAKPSVSEDGRYVVFQSLARNLVPGDTSGQSAIYLRDRASRTTLRISPPSAEGSFGWFNPAMTQDGRAVLFQSYPFNPASSTGNQTMQILVFELWQGDSTGSGMDDAWQMAHFGKLLNNGNGDADGDGESDLDEFRAGTDPTDNSSVLRAYILRYASGPGGFVFWPSLSGKVYQVEYKNRVTDAAWTGLGNPIQASSSETFLADPTTNGQSHRFYRVRLVP